MYAKDLIPYIPLIAAGVTVSGLLLVAWLNNRWAERPRKLDLYKIVYPEKIKAAQSLVGLAASLFEKASQLDRVQKLDDPDAIRDLRAEADNLYMMSISYEWILGSEVCDLSRALAVCIRKLVPDTPRPGGRAQWSLQESNSVLLPFNTAYQGLIQSVRNNLHLESLDMLLPVKQLVPRGERIGLQTQYISDQDQIKAKDETSEKLT